jgi:hypothetical protein
VIIRGGIERYQCAPCSGHDALRSELMARYYDLDSQVSIRFVGVLFPDFQFVGVLFPDSCFPFILFPVVSRSRITSPQKKTAA